MIEKHRSAVSQNISRPDQFDLFILATLDQFAYRYFLEPQAAKKITESSYAVYGLEVGIKEAMKIKNDQLRKELVLLVKNFQPQKPTIMRRIYLKLGGTNAQLETQISFGHPDHLFGPESYIAKKAQVDFDDPMIFRKKFPQVLEDLCELFG